MILQYIVLYYYLHTAQSCLKTHIIQHKDKHVKDLQYLPASVEDLLESIVELHSTNKALPTAANMTVLGLVNFCQISWPVELNLNKKLCTLFLSILLKPPLSS